MSPDEALALCRFAHDAATMLVWGAFAYLAALVPRRLATDVGRRLSGVGTAALVVAVVTSFAALPVEAATIGEGWCDAVNPTTLSAVLFETSAGRAWQTQAAAALLLAAALLIPSRRRQGAIAIAAGLLLASLCLTGHAAMQDGARGVVHRLNDAVHVLSGGAWLGSLVPLLPVLAKLDETAHHHEAAIALRRFSTAGHVAVALVIATGVANTALTLGRWPTAWSSPYQAMLATKVALVAVMTMIALVNRYAVVPRLGHARDASVRSLRRSTLVEIALGLAAVGLVAAFGLLEPA